MGLRTFTLESGSAISRGAHPSLDAAWDHVAGAGSRPILMDVRLDGDDVPAGILDVLHRERPHPALVWITARLLYQLPPTQRALACPRGELADGCPLLLMPSPRSDPAGILRPLVVDRLLRLDPLDPGDPVPTRVARALGTDRRAGLLRLLRRTAERLRRGSGLGAASLRAFEDWVGRRTAELGFRMSREEVREFLPGTPPGKKAPPTPEPLRGEDSGSVAHLARLLAGRGDRPLRGLPDFSARARHAFEREGFVRVSELARLPEAVILGWPKVGEGTVTGMADALVLAVTGVVAEARRASSREAWKAALERPLLEHLEEFVRDASGRDRDPS